VLTGLTQSPVTKLYPRPRLHYFESPDQILRAIQPWTSSKYETTENTNSFFPKNKQLTRHCHCAPAPPRQPSPTHRNPLCKSTAIPQLHSDQQANWKTPKSILSIRAQNTETMSQPGNSSILKFQSPERLLLRPSPLPYPIYLLPELERTRLLNLITVISSHEHRKSRVQNFKPKSGLPNFLNPSFMIFPENYIHQSNNKRNSGSSLSLDWQN
jgi:hypothetical protein